MRALIFALAFFGWTGFSLSMASEHGTPHKPHVGHTHTHNDKCGHKAEKHADHTDYEHDGHLHKAHAGHYDDCQGGEHT